MIKARRRSRQVAMNRISVATNSRNSAKVGDRNSSVGATQSILGKWNVVSVLGPPSMLCISCQSASGRSNTCSFSLSSAPSSGSLPLHSTAGEAIMPTMKVAPAPAAATISTAATARGMRQRSRKPAAGDSMVPTMKAIVIGRKNALAR